VIGAGDPSAVTTKPRDGAEMLETSPAALGHAIRRLGRLSLGGWLVLGVACAGGDSEATPVSTSATPSNTGTPQSSPVATPTLVATATGFPLLVPSQPLRVDGLALIDAPDRLYASPLPGQPAVLIAEAFRVDAVAWSPDGNRLAFLIALKEGSGSRRTPGPQLMGELWWELWISSPVEGTAERVGEIALAMPYLDWSPSGDQIAFAVRRDDGSASVTGMPLEGGQGVNLEEVAAGQSPGGWTADGGWRAGTEPGSGSGEPAVEEGASGFVYLEAPQGLPLAHVGDDGEPQQSFGLPLDPSSISPGRRFAVFYDQENGGVLRRVAADDLRPQTLLEADPAWVDPLLPPHAWTRTGGGFAFVRTHQASRCETFRAFEVEIDAGELVRLPFPTAPRLSQSTTDVTSPDGSLRAALSEVRDDDGNTERWLVVSRADGSGEYRLVDLGGRGLREIRWIGEHRLAFVAEAGLTPHAIC